MRTHFCLYCPHCEELMKSTTAPASYGNPIKTCPKCGKPYIDPNCTEPALKKYKPLSFRNHLLTSFSGAATLSFFVALLSSIAIKDTSIQWLIFGISTVILSFVIFLHLIRSQKEIEKERLKMWQESDQRLRNPKHATALKLYGYSVPAQYLPSRYWEQKDSFSLPGATISSPGSYGKKEQNPKPHMPGGSDKY